MAKSKLGMSSFDLNIKFESREEAYNYAKRLVEFIRYTCKKKGWAAEAMVCISNTKGNSSFVCYERTGKVGRPRKVKRFSPFEKDIDKLKVDWHLHILLVSKPSYTFRELIKKYIDKNWYKDKVKENNFDISKLNGKRAYKKNTNIKKAEYFINQAEDILFCNYNYSNEVVIPKGYSLKDLYNAYMNSKTALVHCRSVGTKKRLELEDKYYDIMNFYFNITKEQDKKMVDKFMKEMRLSKIAENYERIEKNNKVQENLNIRRRKIEEDSCF